MAKIPEASGASVTPLQGSTPGVNVRANEFGAVNRANAEAADAITGLSKTLLEKSKNLQIREETSQARSDYEREVNESTLGLKKIFNESGDHRGYQDSYKEMMADINEDYTDRFQWGESRAQFSEFQKNFDTRSLAQAQVHETSSITKGLVNSRQNTFESDLRSVEMVPMGSDASAKLMRHNTSMADINEEGGFFTPDQLEKKTIQAHEQTFNTLMEGYRSNKATGEALHFLGKKSDPHYKHITSKVDGRIIAQWETRFQNERKIKNQTNRSSMIRSFKELQKVTGDIDNTGAIDDLEDAFAASDFDDKEQWQDSVQGLRAADQLIKGTREMDAGQILKEIDDLNKGKKDFFKENPNEFNSVAQEFGSNLYGKMLKKEATQLFENTADYIAKQDPSVADLSSALTQIDPTDTSGEYENGMQAYLKTVASMADAKKVPNPNLLTTDIKQSITNVLNNPSFESSAAQVGKIVNGFEGYETHLFSQLSVPDGKGTKPAVANGKLLALLTTDPESTKDILKLQSKSVKEQIEVKFKTLKETDPGISKNSIKNQKDMVDLVNMSVKVDPSMRVSKIWSGIIENVELKAKDLMVSEGMEMGEAVEFAKKKIFDNNFSEKDGILIPRFTEVTPDDLEDFMDEAREVVDQMVLPKSLDNVPKNRLKWINSESGVQLVQFNGRGNAPTVIKNKANQPFNVSFEDISSGKAIRDMAPFQKVKKERNLADAQKEAASLSSSQGRKGRGF